MTKNSATNPINQSTPPPLSETECLGVFSKKKVFGSKFESPNFSQQLENKITEYVLVQRALHSAHGKQW